MVNTMIFQELGAALDRLIANENGYKLDEVLRRITEIEKNITERLPTPEDLATIQRIKEKAQSTDPVKP